MAKIDNLTKEATSHLEHGEQIVASVMGAYECKIMGQDSVRNGVFLATDRRIFFYGKKMFGFESESFPYSSLSSFEHGKGLMGASISFYSSGNKVKMKWINAGNIEAFMDAVRSAMAKKSVPAPVAATKTESIDDSIEQIKKLAELKDQGILTEEEFTAKKHKILGI